jgi:hypothetical protein
VCERETRNKKKYNIPFYSDNDLFFMKEFLPWGLGALFKLTNEGAFIASEAEVAIRQNFAKTFSEVKVILI